MGTKADTLHWVARPGKDRPIGSREASRSAHKSEYLPVLFPSGLREDGSQLLEEKGELLLRLLRPPSLQSDNPTLRLQPGRGFTLIELLVVVSVIGILAAIALPNFWQARERAWKAADAANLRAIATALQSYYMDYGDLPPADREAGPFMSHSEDFVDVGNGPAAGGSWDGLPWLLYEQGYLSDWKTLFCPKYLKLYRGGEALKGGHPRYHNFRYAYNSSALSTGGHSGGSGIMTGRSWLVRDLYLPAESGWYGKDYPDYPADYRYPWGEGSWENKLELAVYSDFAVRTVIGGKDQEPTP